MAVESTGKYGTAEAARRALEAYLRRYGGNRPAPIAPLLRPEGLQKTADQIRGVSKKHSGSGK